VLAGDVASRIAVLVTTLVAVRALDPAQFGLYIVLYAIALVAAALWDLGVSVVVSREVGSGRVAAGTALASASRLRVITLPAWFAALAVGLALVKNFPTLSAQVCVPFVLASAGAGMSVIALAALRGAHRFSSASAAQAAGKWSTAGLSALAIVAAGHGDRLFALGMAFAAGELLTFVVSIGLLATARNGTVQRRAPLISLRESLPFAANAAMSMVYNRFDVVLVGALASASAAGLYGAASRTQDALYAIPSALGAVALPMLALVAGQGGPTLVRPLIVRTRLFPSVRGNPSASPGRSHRNWGR
jgi:O-antigen/teichoic acid export membrane protein